MQVRFRMLNGHSRLSGCRRIRTKRLSEHSVDIAGLVDTESSRKNRMFSGHSRLSGHGKLKKKQNAQWT